MAADASRCPSPAELERLLGEQLADADRTAVEAHVETCPRCQERLEGMVAPAVPLFAPPAGASPAGPEPDAAFLDRLRQLPPPATRIGDHAGPPAAGDS